MTPKDTTGYKEQMLVMDPNALRDVLVANFLSPNCHFRSPQAQATIERELRKFKGIGGATAAKIALRALKAKD